MLLPQLKEREFRFRLALRMGLPIFGLALAFTSNTLINLNENIQMAYYFGLVMLLVFSIYFFLFIIYNGFDERITEIVSKTFTRDYLYKYINKEIKKHKEYTLVLVNIENLSDINNRYGIKNGDKVLYSVIEHLNNYFLEKKITNYPIGHIKAGDYIIGLRGSKEEYINLIDMLSLKCSEFQVEDIEVSISISSTDTMFSRDLNHLVDNLFELQEKNKYKKSLLPCAGINPNDLESYVKDAIKSESLFITSQDIFEDDKLIMRECSFRLESKNSKLMYPKTYMKVINRLGLALQYDLMILEKSLILFKDSKERFALSISPSSLRNYKFFLRTKELLSEYTHPTIVFVLSEVEYYSHTERFNTTLQLFRELGVEIAIDRLGSLHSSFLYLRELEIDIVRFDSSYTKKIENEKYMGILKGLNMMAQERGLKTWMRMLENSELKSHANDLGINYVQGKELAQLIQINKEKI